MSGVMQTKPFQISKHVVVEAFKRVKAAKGCAGIDGVSLEAYEVNLKSNLYKLWNRMSSGSYQENAHPDTLLPLTP